MRIKLLSHGGYRGLMLCRFPLEISGDIDVYDDGCDVQYHVMESIDGFLLCRGDAFEGDSYFFYPYEFEVIE